jgi:general stress protein 26
MQQPKPKGMEELNDPPMDDRARALAELARLIDGIGVVMVTTLAADGDSALFRSRPMLLERLEPDGTLIFLTHLSSQKIAELARDPRVNVAFVGDKGDRYVSVSGTGSTSHDPAHMRALWNATYRAWFPGGPDDPDSAILTVRIERVEYWDVPASRLVRLWGVVKALATGQVAESGEHQAIQLGDE